ncbi:MAG TPA: DUF3592 domain-containing protein [Spirochaetota bacterium]|nr:DUF3592 domain-containing protein [Spirochaetota bacterium]
MDDATVFFLGSGILAAMGLILLIPGIISRKNHKRLLYDSAKISGIITGKYAGNRQFRVDVKFEYNGKDYTINGRLKDLDSFNLASEGDEVQVAVNRAEPARSFPLLPGSLHMKSFTLILIGIVMILTGVCLMGMVLIFEPGFAEGIFG